MTTHTAQRLQEMATRLDALMRVQESVEDLLFMIEEVEHELPDGIPPSHHSSTEWSNVLEQIEAEIQDIEGRVR
tara:strand:+ start:7031 stop:7252 length:222 start_codon:yes stop_codon:yes gene_type:complete